MGIYDTIEYKCCETIQYSQTKLFSCLLHVYRIGEKLPTKESKMILLKDKCIVCNENPLMIVKEGKIVDIITHPKIIAEGLFGNWDEISLNRLIK